MGENAPREIDGAQFLENVYEARENGYDRLCAECGIGVYDDTDIHDRQCSEYKEQPHG